MVDVADAPFSEHGPDGSWSRDGDGIGNAIPDGPDTRIGFIVWQASGLGYWRGDIGLATLHTDGTLRVDFDRPWLGASEEDPIGLWYPWVMVRPDGAFDAWCGSMVTWEAGNGEMLHLIKHASRERDGTLRSTGQAIPHALGVAQAFSRQCVVARLTPRTTCHSRFARVTGPRTK